MVGDCAEDRAGDRVEGLAGHDDGAHDAPQPRGQVSLGGPEAKPPREVQLMRVPVESSTRCSFEAK